MFQVARRERQHDRGGGRRQQHGPAQGCRRLRRRDPRN